MVLRFTCGGGGNVCGGESLEPPQRAKVPSGIQILRFCDCPITGSVQGYSRFLCAPEDHSGIGGCSYLQELVLSHLLGPKELMGRPDPPPPWCCTSGTERHPLLTWWTLMEGKRFWNMVAMSFTCMPWGPKLLSTRRGAWANCCSCIRWRRREDTTSRTSVYCE